MEKEDKVYPEEESGDENKSSEEIKEEMETGEKERDVYTKEGREKLVEDAEISSEEAAFMRGEEEAKQSKEEKKAGDEEGE